LLVGKLEIRQRRTDGELFRRSRERRVGRAGRPDVVGNRSAFGHHQLERDLRARMQRRQFRRVPGVKRHQHRRHVVRDLPMGHQHGSRPRVYRDHNSIHGIGLRQHGNGEDQEERCKAAHIPQD
jgi:hypothetical protein